MNLYELLGLKRKNSVLKSVVLADCLTVEGYPLVEVEAYDDTFLNATRTSNMADKTHEYIVSMLIKNKDQVKEHYAKRFVMDASLVWLADYSSFGRHLHRLVDLDNNKV